MSGLAAPERILKKIGICVLCILLVVYVGRQLVNLVNSNLKTEIALAVTGEEAVELDCYIMRDEIVLTSRTDGIMLANVDDGGRISKDREVVRVYYEESDYSVENSIRTLDKKIELLHKSAVDTAYVSADLEKMDADIGELFSNSGIYNAKNDLTGALSYRDDILVQMNKRWLISNPDKSYTRKINQLSNEKMEYRSRLVGSSYGITAPESGYYFATVDGYEDIFSSEKLSGLTIDEFKKMTERSPVEYTEKVAGKIVTDYNWYIACPVKTDNAKYFDAGKTYTVEFTYNYGAVLDMMLHTKITENNSDEAILVFSSNEMPEDFEYTRCQKVRIVHKKYSGLKVPKEAVRVVDDVKGVYVVSGTRIEFKRAEEIYSIDDYYIIDSNPDSPNYEKKYVRKQSTNDDGGSGAVSYYRSLSLYDQVIINGKNIYDGMKIE